MANWCSVVIDIECTNITGAQRLYDRYMLANSIDTGSECGVYIGTGPYTVSLFFCDLDINKNTVKVIGEVKGCISVCNFESIINDILEYTEVVCVALQYEVWGLGGYGELIYSNNKITRKYLPQEFLTADLCESDSRSEDLEALFYAHAVTEVVKTYDS